MAPERSHVAQATPKRSPHQVRSKGGPALCPLCFVFRVWVLRNRQSGSRHARATSDNRQELTIFNTQDVRCLWQSCGYFELAKGAGRTKTETALTSTPKRNASRLPFHTHLTLDSTRAASAPTPTSNHSAYKSGHTARALSEMTQWCTGTFLGHSTRKQCARTY